MVHKTCLTVLRSGDAFYHDEPDEHEREKFRTECWIEQCMFEERICARNEHPAFVPLQLQTPIPGMCRSITLYYVGLMIMCRSRYAGGSYFRTDRC